MNRAFACMTAEPNFALLPRKRPVAQNCWFRNFGDASLQCCQAENAKIPAKGFLAPRVMLF
jgi:hypothetical protein